ncbi:MAG: aminodeoxychorismate synthase component I [Bacteroidales bacterium]
MMFEKTVSKVNALSTAGKPFLFLIDYERTEAHVYAADEIPETITVSMPGFSNVPKTAGRSPEFSFTAHPPAFSVYKKAFDVVQREIQYGNTFLVNLTFKSRIETSLNLEDIFTFSRAKYKLLFNDRFVVFSPETFIRIENGKISCCPMKGTMDASVPDAENRLLSDVKETAEHHTIVDLIRNDLSMVSEDVEVEQFRYIEEINTHKGALLQMSSQISGRLPKDYRYHLGELIFRILPAGSISGAPKPRTLQIIRDAENYNRGFYTGIFGYFDGQNLDSAVMIRFIENDNGQLWFKSGGGITSMSDVTTEYNELIRKIYVPIY